MIDALVEMSAPEPQWRVLELDPPPIGPSAGNDRTAESITLVGKYIYILGGLEGGYVTETSSFCILDVDKREWSVIDIAPGLDGRPVFSIFAHTGTVVEDRIFIIGGVIGMNGVDRNNIVFALDVVLEEFSVAPSIYAPNLAFHSAHQLPGRDDEIIVFAGEFAEAEFYAKPLFSLNTRTMKWDNMASTGPAPCGRGNHGSCLVGYNLFIFGGFDRDVALKDMFVLDLKYRVPVWSEIILQSAPEHRFGTVMFHHQGHLFMFGGKKSYYGGMEIRQDDMHRFDLTEKRWHECTEWARAEKPSKRSNHKAVTLGDKVLVFGGTAVLLSSVLEISFT